MHEATADAVARIERAWRAAQLVAGGSVTTGTLERVLDAHAGRPYHDAGHVAAVLREVDDLALSEGLTGVALACCRLAAVFHDAVQEPGRGDDEERSAALAERELAAAGVEPGVPERVAELVRCTSDHRPPAGDLAAAVLCDADLAVLGWPPEDYRWYAAAVRREYAHVDEAAWRVGRAAVLRDLLARERLYTTPTGRTRREAAARANLAAELSSLTGDGAEPGGGGDRRP